MISTLGSLKLVNVDGNFRVVNKFFLWNERRYREDIVIENETKHWKWSPLHRKLNFQIKVNL